jgi:hypothetical protein
MAGLCPASSGQQSAMSSRTGRNSACVLARRSHTRYRFPFCGLIESCSILFASRQSALSISIFNSDMIFPVERKPCAFALNASATISRSAAASLPPTFASTPST